MGIKSIWIDSDIDDKKLKEIAKKENRSVSNLINNLLKNNYDIFKEKKK